MTTPRNTAASIRDRLRALSRERKRDFNFLASLFCRERYLFRLGCSRYRDNLVLKGGLLLLNSVKTLETPTKDIDLLGIGIPRDIESLKKIVAEIGAIETEDGVRFETQDLTGEEIIKEGGYPGVRLKFGAFIGDALFHMQIDFGFGDIVVPGPVEVEYSTLLDFPPPILKAYSFESVIAEKFEAMVDLGLGNSRMQDFLDLYVLASSQELDSRTLHEAIKQTFTTRKTSLDVDNIVFNGTLSEDSLIQTRWSRFVNRPGITDRSTGFDVVIKTITMFLKPVFASINEGSSLDAHWNPQSSSWIEDD